MKLGLLLLASAVCFGQARIEPYQMAPLSMLLGHWQTRQVEIDFRLQSRGDLIVGRTRPTARIGPWRRMMVIFPEGGEVRAEFFDSRDHAIHYRLTQATGRMLRFEDDPPVGEPVHRLTYERQPNGTLLYGFDTGDRVIDSGILQPEPILRPLSE